MSPEDPEEYKLVGGGDKAFAVEYSVSGWFKKTDEYRADVHNVFRLTSNNKPENTDDKKLGDRTLAAFAHRAEILILATHTYKNLNGEGSPNVVQNVDHKGENQAWHYIYFGYSKPEQKAVAVVQLPSGVKHLVFP